MPERVNPQRVASTNVSSSSRSEVVVVGAGLAGLACARRLAALEVPFVLLEAGDRVGGRVATDEVDGYCLDRGFQVLLDSYPELRRGVDLDALAVRAFLPGALVWRDGRFWRVVDPWRAPLGGLMTLKAPFVGLGDALRMTRLRHHALAARRAEETGSTAEYLRACGLSPQIIEGFFRPFFSGVTLDPELCVPASWFLALFGYFAVGRAVLPAGGMQALPEQLAAGLPGSSLRLGTRVRSVAPGAVVLDSGERIECAEVVLATDASTTAQLLGDAEDSEEPGWLGTTTLYYAAARSPVSEPILVLNGEGAEDGPVNHLAVLSDAQPSYAPEGSALVSVSVLGVPAADDDELDREVRAQLERWYGDEVRDWRRLRVDRIEHALPRHVPLTGPPSSPVGVRVCGDHVATPSIQGSMESGRLTAEAIGAARSAAASP